MSKETVFEITRTNTYNTLNTATAEAKSKGIAQIVVNDEKFYITQSKDIEAVRLMLKDLEESIKVSEDEIKNGKAQILSREEFVNRYLKR